MKMRGDDRYGSGYFGAPRGGRTHQGVDIISVTGSPVIAPISGEVTKIGYPYADQDKKELRYVEVMNHGYRYRFFYLKPVVEVGDMVTKGDIIGICKDLTKFYGGMTNHIHFEIMNKKGVKIDPTPVFHALNESNVNIC